MVTLTRRLAPAILAICGLAACAGESTNGAGLVPQIPVQSATHRDSGSQLHVFTANRVGHSIFGFDTTASGNVSPAVKIGGRMTKLTTPFALGLDSSGNLYAANDGATQVEVYAPGAKGNVKPIRTIGGSRTQLGPTEGLFVDPSQDLWVSSYSNNAIAEYAPGADGNVAPIDVISGSNTQLSAPLGMAMSKDGHLYVANSYNGTILIFAANASGNAAPVGSIWADGLAKPCALVFDSKGRLIVADEYNGVFVFAKGAVGGVNAVAQITGFVHASGVVVDAQDHIWTADLGANAIREYASNANGNAVPLNVITGAKTKLKDPINLILQ